MKNRCGCRRTVCSRALMSFPGGKRNTRSVGNFAIQNHTQEKSKVNQKSKLFEATRDGCKSIDRSICTIADAMGALELELQTQSARFSALANAAETRGGELSERLKYLDVRRSIKSLNIQIEAFRGWMYAYRGSTANGASTHPTVEDAIRELVEVAK